MTQYKLALLGRMRSGKDTVADELIKGMNRVGYFNRLAFADPIKDIVKDYFPYLEGKPRKHYIEIGETFRKLDPDVWVKYLDYQVMFITDCLTDKNIIVTDLRRQNEYDALKAEGFTIIKVDATDDLRKSRILSKGEPFVPEEFYHSTEVGVDEIPYDCLIENNGTYEELMDQVHLLIFELLNGGKGKN